MKRFFKYLQGGAIFMFMILSVSIVVAQPLPPTPASPIGGGLGILTVAGAIWGIKKYRDARK